jgi:hypothetical protein
LAGYSTDVVTITSPHCQSIPIATMLMPRSILDERDLVAMRVDHARREDAQLFDIDVPVWCPGTRRPRPAARKDASHPRRRRPEGETPA